MEELNEELRAPPAARIGDRLAKVGTPSLMLDLDAFEFNVDRIGTLAWAHNVALRPHAKAHKSTAIAKAQLKAGAVGICCQKLSEAYPFVRQGIRDIHLSNEVVGADKMAMAAELAREAQLSMCADHIAQIDALGVAAAQAGSRITILPEVDIGQGRCGVATSDALMVLVERIARYGSLRFGGLQAYHGGIQHLATWNERRDAALHSAEKAALHVRHLEARGIACPVVTGGGTGTVEFDVESGVFTEVQPGSYVFMDGHYGSNEWAGAVKLRHSLFIATTVMSTAKPGMVVCDVGLKGVAVDSGLPRVRPGDDDDLRYSAANDEHGVLRIADGGDMRDRLGERLMLIPGHCDPTANLYRQYVCYRGDTVEALWDIDASGLSR